ncbi:dihydrodipicolinate synthase family protein [Paralimibaculum aggregatum]|uniref:Dihydrodipicolinate synthase family protein n=1 Tax=Paralimibaculum aggregatum TaxID=3036245 RepID=A0ABQ6LQJ7_9RHOB|nr:dihydrodipicolinate synthase family protein [Limibaculum sp. NKW23]GMG84277.1 dihydrodipicolinate synthase family protein [Limibaculum sp. NKW23]
MTSTTPLRASIEDPLWVPVLTHYTPDGGIDAPRMRAHLASLAPHVRQIMLAGSTGDGWELDDARFDALIDLAEGEFPDGAAILFGVLRPTTEAVVARLRHLEARLAASPALRSRFRGAVLCPPVEPEAGQPRIIEHFEAALAASTCPVAVYQLPQVTGCRISPETMVHLAGSDRVTMFKDSSGEDRIAGAADYAGVVLVRGAEGGYAEALQPEGAYHGWLLSTGNALAAPLKRIWELGQGGEKDAARALSDQVSAVVSTVFAAAASEGGANAFSNANRAMDHLRAWGSAWKSAPAALKVDGSPLSEALLDKVADQAGALLEIGETGYLSRNA